MSSHVIKCEYPRIIRHPLAWQFVLNGFDVVLFPSGKRLQLDEQCKEQVALDQQIKHPEINIFSHYFLNKGVKPTKNLSPILFRRPDNWQEVRHLYHPVYKISEKEALQYSLLNPYTGEVKPLFLVVKCSQCDLCVSAKKQRTSDRLILESLQHDNPPMFVRLSFDREHYPKNDHDLQEHTRPIQLFHKRLRKYMQKAGMNTDFKYFVTSEYGSKHGRLHYHALYYGLHNLNYVPKQRNKKTRQKSLKIFLRKI